MSEPFPAHTVETAPGEVRQAMQAMLQRMGFHSQHAGEIRRSTALADGYQALAPFFDKTSLDALWHRRA